jgi:hypothetical protein
MGEAKLYQPRFVCLGEKEISLCHAFAILIMPSGSGHTQMGTDPG